MKKRKSSKGGLFYPSPASESKSLEYMVFPLYLIEKCRWDMVLLLYYRAIAYYEVNRNKITKEHNLLGVPVKQSDIVKMDWLFPGDSKCSSNIDYRYKKLRRANDSLIRQGLIIDDGKQIWIKKDSSFQNFPKTKNDPSSTKGRGKDKRIHSHYTKKKAHIQ